MAKESEENKKDVWILLGIAIFSWLFTFAFAILDSSIWTDPDGDFTISNTLKHMNNKWVPAVSLTIWAVVTLRLLLYTGLVVKTAAWWVVYPLVFWCSVAFVLLGFVYTTDYSYVIHVVLTFSILLSVLTLVMLTLIEYRRQERQKMDGNTVTFISVAVLLFLGFVGLIVAGQLLLIDGETKQEWVALTAAEYSFVLAVLIWTLVIANVAYNNVGRNVIIKQY
jgi:hypothetical protein